MVGSNVLPLSLVALRIEVMWFMMPGHVEVYAPAKTP